MKKNFMFLFSLWGMSLSVPAAAAVGAAVGAGEETCTVASVNEAESAASTAGSKVSDWVKAAAPTFKFGGYITGKYSISDRSGESSNGGFDLRYLRLYANGHCFQDFYYRFQLETCSAPGVDKGPRVLDAFVEWQKFDFLKVKLGQFKRPFGFENPYNPIDVGFGAYSQATSKLAGMSDRNGEHSSGGRDMGVQLQGDLLQAKDGHYWLHYQVGFFNGQGINHTDKDKFKDLIGGLWFSPVKNLYIGGFGWNGNYTNENYVEGEGMLKEAKRVRWGAGLKYESDWTFRGEYMSSVGGNVKKAAMNDRADAWYAAVGAPLFRNFKLYGRWDCYREAKTWNSLKTNYGLSANYTFCKNLVLQLNYNFTDERGVRRAAKDSHYNTFDFQVYARF
ncbi:phosphate-selective porin O and P [gut metagenome]|uniref:Phosphate-selective porin O and P n=1 Tax=gut metagenome TaxID=749906 RepID=J9CUH4_9ZZZZ